MDSISATDTSTGEDAGTSNESGSDESVAKKQDERPSKRIRVQEEFDVYAQPLISALFTEAEINYANSTDDIRSLPSLLDMSQMSVEGVAIKLKESDILTSSDRQSYKTVSSFIQSIIKLRKSMVESGTGSNSHSAMLTTDDVSQSILQALQVMCLNMLDLVAAHNAGKKGDSDPVIDMLHTYVVYQQASNHEGRLHFDSSLDVMSTLIAHFLPDASLQVSDVFENVMELDQTLFPTGWKEIDAMDAPSKAANKDTKSTDGSYVAQQQHGPLLLLLFAFIMLTKMGDDWYIENHIRSAFQLLSSKQEWRPILRKLGAILVGVTPNPGDSAYDECHKLIANPLHFLNHYLYVNKAGGKGNRKNTNAPKLENARALQRMSLLYMCGFLANKFRAMLEGCSFSDSLIFKATRQTLEVAKTINNPLHGLGYDIALREWIKSSTGSLKLVSDRKRLGPKTAEVQLQTKMAELQRQFATWKDDDEIQWEIFTKDIEQLKARMQVAETEQIQLQEHIYFLERAPKIQMKNWQKAHEVRKEHFKRTTNETTNELQQRLEVLGEKMKKMAAEESTNDYDVYEAVGTDSAPGKTDIEATQAKGTVDES